MLYLGIDEHSKQLTVCVRDEEGHVVMQRQVSTKPEKVRAFFERCVRRAGIARDSAAFPPPGNSACGNPSS